MEGGRLYELGTNSVRVFPLAALRATAASMEPLTGSYAGTNGDAGASAIATTTTHTISFSAGFSGTCATAYGPVAQGGELAAAFLPLGGGGFSAADLGPDTPDGLPWHDQVSGSLAPGAVQLSLRATATIGGNACDTGPQSLSLTPVPLNP